VVLTTP